MLFQRYIYVLIYIIVTILLLFFVILNINAYLLNLNVTTAVVNAPIETITSPTVGLITKIYTTLGAEIKQGEPLLRIENFNLEKEMEMAALEAENAKLFIQYYKNLLINEEQRLFFYKNLGFSRLAAAKATLNLTKHNYLIRKKNLTRMQELHKKNYLSDAKWDAELAIFTQAKEKMKKALAKFELENHSLNAIEFGMYFTGNKLEGKKSDFSTEIDLANQRLALSLNKLKIFKHFANKLILVAPFDGRVVQILKSEGNNTDTSKPLLLIQQAKANKEIIAFLRQDEVTHLGLNTKVKIYIPALKKTYRGNVASIDRTSGFIDEVKSQYRWRNLYIDRSATAIVNLNLTEQEKFNREVFAGMPAIIYFPRRFTIF